MKTHCVAQGECLANIAAQYGFNDYTTIWNATENVPLKRKRPNPNVLCPNDAVIIPDKRQNAVGRPTDQKHCFQVKSSTVLLRLALVDFEGQPYRNARYSLQVDNHKYVGTTNSEGLLQATIPAEARQGRLTMEVQTDGHPQVLHMSLAIGGLDPIDAWSGVQQRLYNLGFQTVEGRPDSDGSKAALKAFQEKNGLPVTGSVDAPTRSNLLAAHGC